MQTLLSIEKEKHVSTIGYDQHEMISNIIKLHCPDGIEADLTYSKGKFYGNKVFPPKYKFDKYPQKRGVIKADSRDIPLLDEKIKTLMFDPPFLAGISKSDKSIITKRFTAFESMPKLWTYYNQTLKECYRVLKPLGILIFKCQDTVSCSQQYFTHNEVMNYAVKTGFYPKDLFILLADTRIMDNRWKKQQHARKYHCYFWVFKKERCPIKYVV